MLVIKLGKSQISASFNFVYDLHRFVLELLQVNIALGLCQNEHYEGDDQSHHEDSDYAANDSAHKFKKQYHDIDGIANEQEVSQYLQTGQLHGDSGQHFGDQVDRGHRQHLEGRGGIECAVVSFAEEQTEVHDEQQRDQVHFDDCDSPRHGDNSQILLQINFSLILFQYDRHVSGVKFKFKVKYYLQLAAMEQDQICELLKQIIPELQAKIRIEMQAELQQKLATMQARHQQEIEALVKQQTEIKNQYQRQIKAMEQQGDRQVLYERIAMLEAQRNNWSRQQAQYQTTIKELTGLLASRSIKPQTSTASVYNSSKKTMAESKISSVSAIHPPPKIEIVNQNLYQIFKKQKPTLKQQPRLASNPNSEHDSQICLEQSLSKYVKQDDDLLAQEQNKQHYRSVLSPPKLEPVPLTAKPIFWNEAKKKHLLSLIKLH